MTIKRGALILLTLFLAGCSASSNNRSIPGPSKVPSSATAALPTIPKVGTVNIFTYTPKPSNTPTIIPSITPVPSATPTFDVSSVSTATHSTAEECPTSASVELPDIGPNPEKYRPVFRPNDQKVLDYLTT